MVSVTDGGDYQTGHRFTKALQKLIRIQTTIWGFDAFALACKCPHMQDDCRLSFIYFLYSQHLQSRPADVTVNLLNKHGFLLGAMARNHKTEL